MGKRITLTLLAGFGLSTLLAPPVVAKPSSLASYVAPFGHTREIPACDDGDGSAVCDAAATVNRNGDIDTYGSLRPADLVATTARAEGRGGPQISHKLAGAYTSVRYSFIFENVVAKAEKEPAIARDIDARSVVAGFVYHANCKSCTTQVATTVADADLLTPQPTEITAQTVRVDVEVRNPDGKVPKGQTFALGYILSDVAMYNHVPAFTSAAQAKTSGRLVRVEVSPTP